jgi:ATP-dependent Clp protease ATP-binding subunit ClpA
MAATAVRSGLSLITYSDQDISRVLLVMGVGVLTYEIVSKAVQKAASETLTKKWVMPLVVSTFAMIYVSKMELPTLQGHFAGLCVTYVIVAIAEARSLIKESSLPDYMVDMVAEAKGGAYLSKIGYEEAVGKVEVLMNAKKKSNAILLGHPGVGKSTIPETIAYKIANAQYVAHSVFFNAKLISVDFTDLMANTLYRGMLEQRVKEMTQLAKKDPKIIYFIDEIHKLAGGGQTVDSRVDVSEMLLPVLARGEIRVIGASTHEDYKRSIEPKGPIARRLPKVMVDEPTIDKCYEMLQHSYGQISKKGRIKISDGAIAAAIVFSKDIPQRYFPDKAIELIDFTISDAELENVDTENDLILREQDVAKAVCSIDRAYKVKSLILSLGVFIAQHEHYFPGLEVKVD